MVILFIGKDGFLGSHLLNSFKSSNNLLLYGVKSMPRKLIANNIKSYYLTNLDNINKLSKINIDIVINTAVVYGKNNKNSKLWETNVKMPLMLTRIVKNPECIFINFGSFYTKFSKYPNLKKYSDSKIALNNGLKKIKNKKIVMLHLEHLYGENDSKDKFIPTMLENLINGVNEIKLTNCNQKRDFVHVDDITKLIHNIIDQKSKLSLGMNEFEVGTGKSIPIKKLLILMKKKTDSSTNLNFGALELDQNEIMDSKANISSLIDLFGWAPEISIKKGIDSLILSQK